MMMKLLITQLPQFPHQIHGFSTKLELFVPEMKKEYAEETQVVRRLSTYVNGTSYFLSNGLL